MCAPNSQWRSKAEYLMKVFVQLCSGQVNILVVWLVSHPPLLGFVPSSDQSELLKFIDCENAITIQSVKGFF